ncbi:response regulator [Sedimenticola hydrogenitrophicus]|uniref:response regulator n=1 Tax=Sedimenticola hydrogenitrophicus TaxID=2967975 RepID=UPI0021A869EC|nr:response regulator [Sedimenticola hydrogenitrophicus]
MNPAQHLLIVEDNRSLRQMLTWEFEDLGYRVTATDCCTAAIAAAETGQVDLGLLDYNLPDGCGMELVERLRALNPAMRIILCSGFVTALECDQPCCRFQAKPVSAQRLHRLFQSDAEWPASCTPHPGGGVPS